MAPSVKIGPGMIRRTVDGFMHATNAENLPSILKRGLLLNPGRRTYQNTIGGIYLACPKSYGGAFTMISESDLEMTHVAEIFVRVHAGTRFCLDEDELDDTNKIRELFPRAVAKKFDVARARLKTLRRDTPEELGLRDELSCWLARELDHRHILEFDIRVFDPPEVVSYEITELDFG